MITARNAALKTLVRIDSEQAFSNLEVNKMIRNSQVKKKDKALYVNLVYGTLQRKLTLDKILKQYIEYGFDNLNDHLKWILRIALYQILFLSRTPDYAVVNEAVKQIQREEPKKKSLVNAVLRNIIRNKNKILKELKSTQDVELKYSVPLWIYEQYQETYGDKADEILQSINKSPKLSIRVKPNYFDTVYKALEKTGAEPEKSNVEALADCNILINKPSAIQNGVDRSKAFNSGMITIQDRGAIEIGLEVEPEPRDKVLDLCAAPGSKSTHLAELMDNRGSVIACDIHPNRLKLVRNNAKRMKSKIIKTMELDATNFQPGFKDRFDKVLADVPCSGLGVIRRKPDIRYRVEEEDLDSLAKTQKKILLNAFEYTKPGGTVVYSTCTVGKKENEEVVQAVKNMFGNQFKIIREEHISGDKADSDCFYYAVIKKEKEE